MNSSSSYQPGGEARRQLALAGLDHASRFVELDGHRFHLLDAGSQNGRPVLMVHGNPTWCWYWRHLVHAVSPRHRAIAVDHLGCGLSDHPDGVSYTLDSRNDHLARLVQQLDLHDVTLVVHDWGGAIGLGAALRELDRYRSFVLLNTGAFPPPFFPWRIRICRTPVLGRIAVQGLNVFARAATWMATTRPGGLPGDVCDGLLAPWDSWSARRAIYEFVADIPVRQEHPTMQRLIEIESRLGELRRFPVRMLWGMRDWCFRPECLRRFQQHWPHAHTTEFPGAGHYLIEDAREEVIRHVCQFLEANDSCDSDS